MAKQIAAFRIFANAPKNDIHSAILEYCSDPDVFISLVVTKM
jgi:hypothetical protein